MQIYLDTISIVKRYIHEKGTDVVDRVYLESEAGRIKVAFSIWNIGEAIGVLGRYRTRNLISERDLKTALLSMTSESLKLIRLSALQVIPITYRNLTESWQLVLKHHIYEADAIQVSSAKEVGCDLLLSADQRLSQAAQMEDLEVLNIVTEPEKALKKIIES